MSTSKFNAITQYLANGPPLKRYKVGVMGGGLTHIHIETVNASSPGDALDMVCKRPELLGKTLSQYGVLLLPDEEPTKLEAV